MSTTALTSILSTLVMSLICTSALASEPVPREVRCDDERQNGIQLVIEDTGLEGISWKPSLEVRFERYGQNIEETLTLVMIQNTKDQLRLEGQGGRRGNDIYVIVFKAEAKAYFGEVANNGLSPLPPAVYQNCVIR